MSININQSYPIIIEKNEDGYYGECPFVQGVYSQGESEAEVRRNLQEVMQMTIDDMRARGELETLKSNSFVPSITISSLSFAI